MINTARLSKNTEINERQIPNIFLNERCRPNISAHNILFTGCASRIITAPIKKIDINIHTNPPKLEDMELLFSNFITGNIMPKEIASEVSPDVRNKIVIKDK